MGHFGKPWKGSIDSSGRFILSHTFSSGNKVTVHKDADNRRVKNARKVENMMGEKFDSSLEMYMDSLLKKSGIEYERQKEFILTEKFTDRIEGENVREMKWIVDFWIPRLGIIVDTKGWNTEVFVIKYKIFRWLLSQGMYPQVKAVKFAKKKNDCVILSIELASLYLSLKT